MKYKYGVEYETNGKKPDLPSNVAIKVKGKMINGNEYIHAFYPDMVDWLDAISFRIVDERYRPVSELVKQGQEICGKIEEKLSSVDDALNWYDYDKQKAIALPPVGVECQWLSYRSCAWHQTKVKAYDDEFQAWLDGEGIVSVESSLHKFRPLDWSRKADEERDNAVCAAFKSLTISNSDLAYKICQDLYDNGYLKNKAAS